MERRGRKWGLGVCTSICVEDEAGAARYPRMCTYMNAFVYQWLYAWIWVHLHAYGRMTCAYMNDLRVHHAYGRLT